MNLNKTSNKTYIFFLASIAILTITFVTLSFLFKTENKNKTSNYEQAFSLNSYNIKVSDAFYNTKTSSLSVIVRIKSDYSSATTPEIDEIFIKNSLEYNYTLKTIDSNTKLVTIKDVPSDFSYVRLRFSSKKADITPEPTQDVFGDIVTQPVIKGEKTTTYVYIDYRDIARGNNTPTYTSHSVNSDVDEVLTTTTLTASETPSVAVSTTTPKVTTVTSKTSQNAPQTVVTTTTKKPSTPKVTTATTTAKKPTTVTTTTPKKTTVTATVTTTTKKPATVTTTTQKATTTTTTTKKKTTTTTTTTVGTTTTTVYIRLTGLALAEKGSEELLLGESITLTPVYTPSRATNKKVYWESNRPDRVIVDSNGKCTAVGVGAAIIICTSDDGGLTAAYMVIGVDK